MTSIAKWFRSLVDIRRGERMTVALMFAYGFLALTSYYVIKPARNSIFLDRVGSDMLPLIYILTAIFIIAVMVVYSRYVERIGRMTLLLGSIGFLAVTLVGFWWVLDPQSGLLSSGAFYIFVKLYPLLLVSQFWLVGNLLFTTTQARRLFGPIGVGLILGGIAGSGIAGGLADVIGTTDLLLVATAILLTCGGLVVALSPRMERAGGTSARLTEELSGTAVQLLRKSSHLKTIAAILGLTIVVGTLLDWQLNRAVEMEIAGADAKTEFFGLFYGVLNVVSVSIQVLITGAVLRRFGLRVALLVLPVGLALTSVGVLVIPGLITATLAKGTEGALRYSLDQSTRELLFLPVPETVKYKVKPLIDLGVYRGGTGLGGLLLLLFVNGLGFSLRAISIVTLVTIAVWLIAAVRMRREFGDSLRRLIGVRDVKLEELVVGRLNPSVWKEIGRVLRRGDEEQIEYALALLEIDPTASLADDVAPLLEHESPDVRARAVRLLEEMEADDYLDEVRGLLDDDSLEVQADAIQFLCRLDPDPLSDLEDFLEDDSLALRTAALGCLLRRRGDDGRSRGLDYVEELARSDDPEERRQAATLLGEIDDPAERAVELLSELVKDPEVAVCHRAMEAAGRSGVPELVPVLLDRLHDPDYRAPAAAALRAYGNAISEQLVDRMLDDHTPTDVRVVIPSRLLPDPDDRAVGRMLDALPEFEAVVRYEVLKALNKLRRRDPDRAFPDIDEEALIEREMEMAHEAIALARPLRESEDEHLLLLRTLEERKLQAVERALRTIALHEPPGDLYSAFTALNTGDDAITRQRGYELMDTVLPQRFRAVFATAVDPDTPDRGRRGAVRRRRGGPGGGARPTGGLRRSVARPPGAADPGRPPGAGHVGAGAAAAGGEPAGRGVEPPRERGGADGDRGARGAPGPYRDVRGRPDGGPRRHRDAGRGEGVGGRGDALPGGRARRHPPHRDRRSSRGEKGRTGSLLGRRGG